MDIQQDDSWLREQLRREKADLVLPDDDGSYEFGAPLSPTGWFRLILAVVCLSGVVSLTGHRFVDYVIHHVWNQSRNSPAALIVPVLVIQFLWLIVHVNTGSAVARLKIGLGAAALCVAFFAPSLLSGGTPRRSMDLRQVCSLALAAWVFVDGWRDRRSSLRDDQSSDLAGQRP